MTEFTRDEALAFLEATRVVLDGKVGFKFHVKQLQALGEYIDRLGRENEVLNAFIDTVGDRDALEAFKAKTQNERAAEDLS